MEKEKKVSEYITQTEAYQFGKNNAIRLVKSKQQASVALGARYLLDIYKYSYLEIAQFVLDSYDIVSLEDIVKHFSNTMDNITISLPISEIKVSPKAILDGYIQVRPPIKIKLEVYNNGDLMSYVTLLPYQNITFYALIEDELHKYLKKSSL